MPVTSQNISGNAATSSACTGNAATSSACTGNAATSSACTGNAASATKLSNAAGSAPSYSCRAWVNFNGSGTPAIIASGNVSSITDNGIGQFTVNLTTAMQNTSYAALGMAQRISGNTGAQIMESELFARTASSLPILTTNQSGGVLDPLIVSITFYQ